MVSDLSYQLMDLYGHYKQGYLPFAGGVLDQPNIFGEAMAIIDGSMNQQQAERAKRDRRG